LKLFKKVADLGDWEPEEPHVTKARDLEKEKATAVICGEGRRRQQPAFST
jgi:hypothetical protein